MAMSVRRCTLTIGLLMLFLQHNYQIVKAQEVDNFSCTFSGCAGEDMVCYCSVPNDLLFWWGRNICITMVNNSNQIRHDHNLVAEVVDTSPSGEFTSKLTRRNISTGLNGTEMGCSRSTCNSSRASQNSSFTLNVQSCRAPNPPRNLMVQDTKCNSTMKTVILTWMDPEPALLQFPVTNYNLTCTSSEGESCNETLPANNTSFELPVVAGVQYTITVSALSNGRESQQLNYVASFCNGTTPSTSRGTETTTPETPSTPTSEGIQTTSTPTTDLGPIIGPIGSIVGLILIITIVVVFLCCCKQKGKQKSGSSNGEQIEMKERDKEVSVKKGEEEGKEETTEQ